MGLFGAFDPLKEAGGWENNMTEAEIAEMEKKGYDVSSLRATRASTAAEEAAEEEAFAQRRRETAVATDLNKLTPYRTTPRSDDTPFFRDVAGKPPLFGKDKWRKKIASAPLVYCAVVQANSDLWLPGNNTYYPAVFVFALDRAHIYDVEWLASTAKTIKKIKECPDVPDDCREFIEILRDDKSEFCFPLGDSLAQGADAWCATYKFEKQTILPGSRLPENGIVPFLLESPPKKQMPIQLRPIMGKYYQY